MKVCTCCGVSQILSSFHKDKNRPDGCRDVCKSCRKMYYLSRGGRVKTWEANLKSSYGADLSWYKKQFDTQGGKCAICDRQISYRGINTHVDHNHKTKVLRGLLCRGCNINKVGFIESSLYQKTLRYLGID